MTAADRAGNRSAVDDIAELIDTEWLFVLKGYFDESQQGAEGRILAIAGYVAHVRYWRRLSREWNNVLLRHGIKHGLHMKEFAQCRGEFEKFKNDEPNRRKFLGELIRTLYKDPHFAAFGCAIDLDEFEALPLDSRMLFRNDPYLMCFLISVRAAVEFESLRQLPATEKVGFVFDRHSDLQARALALFNVVKDTPTIPERGRIGDLAFGSREALPPLQAADFVAYEARKGIERRKAGLPERWGIQQIKSLGNCQIYMLDRPSLLSLFSSPSAGPIRTGEP